MESSSQASVSQDRPRSESRGISGLGFEVMLALAALTAWPLFDERHRGSTQQRARAMLFFPLVGLLLGIALALIDRSLTAVMQPLWRSATVVGIAIFLSGAIHPRGLAHAIGELQSARRPAETGLTEIGPAGAVSALGWLVLEVCLLASIHHPPSRAGALVLATMLSRWAIVPIGYGLRPLERRGLGVSWEGAIKFREFAGSSVIALAIAMGLYQVIAIATVVALALTILLLRLLFSRRLGGVSGFALAAGAAVSELVALAACAALRF